MRELTMQEMTGLEAEGFWGGLACGLGLAASAYAAVSPEPFSKIALVTYGGTLVGCVDALM